MRLYIGEGDGLGQRGRLNWQRGRRGSCCWRDSESCPFFSWGSFLVILIVAIFLIVIIHIIVIIVQVIVLVVLVVFVVIVLTL